jgi:hypothetical protein
MDWKVPATIIILAVIVGVGVLPLISPEFNQKLRGHLSEFSSLSDLLRNFFPDRADYEAKIIFSMSVNDFPIVKTRTPVTITIDSPHPYALNLDGKNMSAVGRITLKDFKGEINLRGGSITGTAQSVSSDSFTLSGKTHVSSDSLFAEEVTIEGLKIAEMSVNGGTLKTDKPQEMEAKIANNAVVRGFMGKLTYKNGIGHFAGSCFEIRANSLVIGGPDSNAKSLQQAFS